jgi:rare lipoprotein A
MKCVNIAVAAIMVANSTPAFAVGSQMSIIASYYGNAFKGKKTANGEIFDPAEMTAAHKTLPFGTCLLVSYNSRTVIVRINDRGPYIKGRSLDLSHYAAKVLDMEEVGVAPVVVEEC